MPQKHLKIELNLTYVALALTLLFTGLALAPIVSQLVQAAKSGHYGTSAELILFLLLALILIYGGVVYQVARLGYFKRLRAHRPADEAAIEDLLWGPPGERWTRESRQTP